MAMRFRKSINLGGGTKLNISKSGVGISTGVKGFRKSINTSGRSRTSISIPGTGLSYVKQSGGGNSRGSRSAGGSKPPFFQRGGVMWTCLVLLAPLGIFLMWRNKKDWNKWVKVALSVFFGLFWVGCLISQL